MYLGEGAAEEEVVTFLADSYVEYWMCSHFNNGHAATTCCTHEFCMIIFMLSEILCPLS